MHIRPATPEDAAGTVALLNAVIATGTETSMSVQLTLQEQLQFITCFPSNGVFLVAEVPGPDGVVGMQSIEPYVELGGQTAHVAAISTFVAAEYRRRGIGRKLLNELCRRALGHGTRKLLATIRADNLDAQRFYKHSGFRVVGTLRSQLMYRGTYIDQVLAERLLSDSDA